MELPTLFDTVAHQDFLGFGEGGAFDPGKVSRLLELQESEVSKITSTPISQLKQARLPSEVVQHLEQIGMTCNLVAGIFDGDVGKTVLWFRTKNPMLGDISPRDMVRLGRFDRLRHFIIGALSERSHQRSLLPS